MSHDTFAELRSLMQSSKLYAQQREQLWQLILHEARTHPEVYRSQWVPYMLDFPRHFEEGLSTIDDEAALRQIPSLIGKPVRLNVDFNDADLGDDAIARLASIFPRDLIHTLNLDLNDISVDGLDALLNTEGITAVVELYLGCNFLQDEGVQRLFLCNHLHCLTTLDLSYNELTEQSITALTNATASFRHLKALYLSGNPFDPQYAHILTSNEIPFVLSELYLWCCELGANSITQLVAGPNADQLTLLNLGECNMESEGLAAVAANCPKLESLTIWRNNIEDAGLVALAKSNLRHLQFLDIHDNHIEDEGLIALAQSPVLRTIKTLNLTNTHVGDAGLMALAQSPNVKSLESLIIKGITYTSASMKALQSSPAFEHVEIVTAED